MIDINTYVDNLSDSDFEEVYNNLFPNEINESNHWTTEKWHCDKSYFRVISSYGDLIYFTYKPKINFGGYFGEDKWDVEDEYRTYKSFKGNKIILNVRTKGECISNWMNTIQSIWEIEG